MIWAAAGLIVVLILAAGAGARGKVPKSGPATLPAGCSIYFMLIEPGPPGQPPVKAYRYAGKLKAATRVNLEQQGEFSRFTEQVELV